MFTFQFGEEIIDHFEILDFHIGMNLLLLYNIYTERFRPNPMSTGRDHVIAEYVGELKKQFKCTEFRPGKLSTNCLFFK